MWVETLLYTTLCMFEFYCTFALRSFFNSSCLPLIYFASLSGQQPARKAICLEDSEDSLS